MKVRAMMGDIESRMGIEPIDTLLAQRDALVKEVAPLRARHGPFGTYNDLRKIELAQVGTLIRANALNAGTKATEAFLDEQAHASTEYADFVIRATEEKARWAEVENQIQAVNDRILRANAVARFLAQEAALAR